MWRMETSVRCHSRSGLAQIPRASAIGRPFLISRLRAILRNSPLRRTKTAASAQETPSSSILEENGNAEEAPEIPGLQDMLAEAQAYNLQHCDWNNTLLSIVVIGASGDLAKKKLFPALYALYNEGSLPPNFQVFGYARTKMSDEDFRLRIAEKLSCRVDFTEDKPLCNPDDFLDRVHYVAGPYDDDRGYANLHNTLLQEEGEWKQAHRLFYLSIPPGIFVDAAQRASRVCSSSNGWTRVVVEKPFGRDLPSSRQLAADLYKHLSEEQIYRIDHYLGKELIENLLVLRFSNLIFEPLWSRNFIRSVQIIFSEDFGTDGRGGYFDQYGIIRDIIQNHLLQIMALFAMEPPVSLSAEDIRNEKVKVLKSMKAVRLEDVVVGQYRSRIVEGVKHDGYLEDPTVPDNSLTPTFAAIAMFINNARWDGVPFLFKAGKALGYRGAQIRVQFRHVPGNLYQNKLGIDLDRNTNELVIRIQPKEAIYFKINNKVPGLGLRLDTTRLDLPYDARYNTALPDAYERLILDVINGDKRLFIRYDELDTAWQLFTPILHELEERQVVPELYPHGSRGPVGAHYLAAKYGVRWGDLSEYD